MFLSNVIRSNDEIYPSFGEGLCFTRVKVIGDCVIGSNVVFGSNTMIIDSHIPDNLVVGIYPNHQVFPNKINVKEKIFGYTNAEN